MPMPTMPGPATGAVLATAATLAMMRTRMGEDAAGPRAAGAWLGRAAAASARCEVWLQPAGHVLGSAQVAME